MPSHLIRISAEQFKKVKVIDFVPNRYVTKISGANGAGKTSALDAIFQALAPRKTLSPTLLRQGQKKGFLRIETTTHIITRKLDEKGGALQIEAKATGTLVKAPDDWLEGIAGELGFDPLKFMRLKPEDQFDVLKSLLPAMAQVDDLEMRNADDAETLKRKRAEAKQLEAARDHITVDVSLPSQAADVNALLAEARSAREHNASIEREQRERAEADRKQQATLAEMQDIERKIKQLNERMETLATEHGYMTQTLKERKPLPEPKDTHAIDEKISSAAATNSRITANNTSRAQKANFDNDVEAIKEDIKKIDKEVTERKITIARTLAEAKFPVPGLSFETIEEGSGGRDRKNPKKIVTYNGVPLSEASSAEQIEVSTRIGMAGKQDLRFLLIREASLLDDDGMATLEKLAHEHEFQILCEIVDTSGKVGIYMEDGEIKNVNPDTPPAKPTLVKKATKKASNQQELMQ
jgi:predicted ATP-dependent endonuclease of OLD family